MPCRGEVVFLLWCQYFLLWCGFYFSVMVTTRPPACAERPGSAVVRSEPQHTLLGFPLRSISFANPSSTTCYMNCSLHAVLHILALLRPQDQAALGQLSHIWGAIQRHPQNFSPSQHFPWVMLLSPWTRLFEHRPRRNRAVTRRCHVHNWCQQ